jgi:type IV pilus assembly protein PilX
MHQGNVILPQSQQGAVLIVSLVLLLVMTIIGVAAIDSTQLQSQMARNSLFAQNLHQASLSEIQVQDTKLKGTAYVEQITISTTDILATDYKCITSNGVGVTYNTGTSASAGIKYDQSGAVTFIGNAPPPSGYSLGTYIGKRYEICAISEVPGTSAKSEQTQGLTRVAPLST